MAQRKFLIDAGFQSNGDSVVSGNLTISGTPVAGTDAVTKSYVDSAIISGTTTSTNGLASEVYVDSAFIAESTTRAAADTALDTRVTANEATIVANTSAINSEATARATGDTNTLSSANSYTDSREAAITTAYQTYANAAEADAIATAAADATSKANAAEAAAINAVTNGAGAAFDTLKEIQDAMATDAELSSAIASITTVANANKLSTARTIALSGDVSGSVAFDGSANATITATVADDSHNHTVANVDGLQAIINNYEARIAALEATLANVTAVTGGIRVSGSVTATGDVTAYGS